MPYESNITFTLDTICPWTYIAYLRLQKALAQHPPSPNVSFTLRLAPYQLYPDFSPAGEDRYVWYMREKYAGDARRMGLYAEYMRALGRAEGVEIDFLPHSEGGGGGAIANTLHAHRVLHYVQEHKGPEAACRALESLYEQYFAGGGHPSAAETLLRACEAGEMSTEEGSKLVEDESEGLTDVRREIGVQAGNGVDSVPYVVVEGRRRDFTLVGAKEVREYVRVLEQVGREA